MSDLHHRALAMYLAADAHQALALLGASDDVDDLLLRARIHHRQSDWNLAVHELDRSDFDRWSADQRAHGRFLAAASLTQLRQFDRARRLLDDARTGCLSSSDRALEAEFHYYDLSWHFARGAFDAAEVAADNALHCELVFGDVCESRHVVPLGVTKSRAHSALGIISGAREDYFGQARHFRDAVEIFEGGEHVDDWTYAAILMNLSYSARDLDLVDDAGRVQRALQRPWAPALDYYVFEMRRSMAWHHALNGDLQSAIDAFELAIREARSRSLVVLVRTELFQVRREFVAPGATDAELRATADLAAAVDWEKSDEERSALMALARELAPLDVAAAREMVDRYRRLRTPLAPRNLDSRDRRLIASERLAEGIVLRFEGRSPEAVRAFFDAFEIWHDVGFRWQAALAAIELAEIEGSSYFTNYVRTEASRRPASWLARRAKRLPAFTASGDPLGSILD